jgi:hypothetical protein
VDVVCKHLSGDGFALWMVLIVFGGMNDYVYTCGSYMRVVAGEFSNVVPALPFPQ